MQVYFNCISSVNQVRRDTDMDNSMLIHEATHGITNRLTGGGTADCLGSLYSSGLGEGWSDIMAEYVIPLL